MTSQSIDTKTLNTFFELGLELEAYPCETEFEEMTWECDSLADFVEGADEGTCYREEDETYYKIRNKDGDCEVFFFLKDKIKQL